jgi:Zn finger protein HypA/HybF involved in hydrogenase expression
LITSERIFEQDDENKETFGWQFVIEGSRGTNYRVSITTESASCTCPDCSQRARACKHIYFVLCRVARAFDFVQYLPSSQLDKIKLNNELNALLETRLVHRHNREEKEGEKNDIENEIKRKGNTTKVRNSDNCPICFDEVDVAYLVEDFLPEIYNSHSLIRCEQCWYCFHHDCIKRALRRSARCPMCNTYMRMPTLRPRDRGVDLKLPVNDDCMVKYDLGTSEIKDDDVFQMDLG